MRLLIVEDDPALASALENALQRRDIQSDVAATIEDARHMLGVAQYAGVVLDLGLPDGDGLSLLRELRVENNAIPVLAITARSALDARVTGLNSGADDYLTKPFEVDELVARLHAVLRRQGGLSGSTLTAGNLSFDTVSGDLMVEGVPVILSARERQLAGLLLRRLGQVVRKPLAEDQLYGLSDPVGSNALEVLAYRLRRKLEIARASVRIETIRGVGYIMREPTPPPSP